jgi:hypothetical protein
MKRNEAYNVLFIQVRVYVGRMDRGNNSSMHFNLRIDEVFQPTLTTYTLMNKEIISFISSLIFYCLMSYLRVCHQYDIAIFAGEGLGIWVYEALQGDAMQN